MLPCKNSKPLCAGPTVGANCRGIVTSDVLLKGLIRGAIATRKLKGVNRDKGHERFYTSSAPYDEGKSLRLVVFGIVGFSKSEYACPGFELLSLPLCRRRVVPLYTRVDA